MCQPIRDVDLNDLLGSNGAAEGFLDLSDAGRYFKPFPSSCLT